MINLITLGMMLAEWNDTCVAIDKRATEAKQDMIAGAFQDLLNNDTAGRDRKCRRGEEVDDVVYRAKIEAGLRIADRYGLDRDEIEHQVKERLKAQRNMQ